jgi:hypothetical protein
MSTGRPDADGEPRVDDADLPPLADHLRNPPDAPRDHGVSQGRLIVLLLFGALPLIVVFVIVLSSLASGPPTLGDRSQGQATSGLNAVTRYCTYAAKTEADFVPCLNRTSAKTFAGDRSNAARYARGELDRCLPDAGPRCTLR